LDDDDREATVTDQQERATSGRGPGGQGRPAQFTATQAKNEFGRILDAALQSGMVVITKHDIPKAILVSVDQFDALTHRPELALNTLSEEFDALFAGMQTSRARRAMQAAFEASPKELGKAAVIAARKRG
jgi:antitoxin Phd